MIKFVNTFEKHRNEPERSLNDYTQSVRIELGQQLKNQFKIYIDTKFWIHFREIILNRNTNNKHIELLQLLRAGLQQNKLLCPISDEIIGEILLQTNPQNLQASAKLIDELSKGVSVLSSREREKYEILHFIYSNTDLAESIHEQEVFVWSKIPFAFDLPYPHLDQIPPDEELVIQKTFFDQMWSISFSEMIEIIGHKNILSWPRERDISSKLTKGKFEHMKENQSFKQLHLEEISGVLDIYKSLFEDAMSYLFESKYKKKPNIEEVKNAESGQKVANIIYHSFNKNKLGTYLPSLVIEAGLHAMVRYDKERKFKKNDMPDFRHAKTALPYFDLFLTENSLCHLVKTGKLAFDKKYNCKVYSDPKEAIKYIEKIVN